MLLLILYSLVLAVLWDSGMGKKAGLGRKGKLRDATFLSSSSGTGPCALENANLGPRHATAVGGWGVS